MYRHIELDCQTKDNPLHCEDCIAYRTCKAHAAMNRKQKQEQTIAVATSEAVGVWQASKKRKPLPP